MKILEEAWDKWNIKEFAFPKEIKRRKMSDIPHYPYRDDGILVWDAIHAYVSNYLNHFYTTPETLSADTELQSWAAELSDENGSGGKVKGMPSTISSVDELVEIITTIIFICGPQHSAINFAQYEYMAFTANMPLAGYRDINNIALANTGISAEDVANGFGEKANDRELITSTKILEFLPPYHKTADQLKTLFILTAYRYDRLGYYDKAFEDLYGESPKDIFSDKDNQANRAVLDIIMQFQQALNVAEQKIDANNRKRLVPYHYLKPSLILNSISI